MVLPVCVGVGPRAMEGEMYSDAMGVVTGRWINFGGVN